MQRNIIKPQLDTPVIVRLDRGPLGIETRGNYGTDFQYTVNDNSGVMWLPPEGRDALLKCMARAGDVVEIVKFKRGTTAYFNAHVLPETAVTPTAPPPQQQRQPEPPPPPPPAQTKALTTSTPRPYRPDDYPPPHNYPRPSRTPQRDLPRAAYYQPDSNDMREPEPFAGQPASQPMPAQPQQPAAPASGQIKSGQITMTQRLERCLIVAIDAAQAAAAHSQLTHGITLTWTTEDVRAMGLSVFINLQREQR